MVEESINLQVLHWPTPPGSVATSRQFDLESYFPGKCILLEIMLPKTMSILFGTFYRLPLQADFMDSFVEVLDSMCLENKELIITSDFIIVISDQK